jgi:diguanylate cyclase (GGDEF)-like protein
MKWVNDTFGHLEGDRALTDIAQILKKTLRASDIVARWGGDEFVALMTEATESAGEAVFARLLETMAAHNMQENRPYQLSISVGITRYDPA